jgi:hypothetical protein
MNGWTDKPIDICADRPMDRCMDGKRDRHTDISSNSFNMYQYVNLLIIVC